MTDCIPAKTDPAIEAERIARIIDANGDEIDRRFRAILAEYQIDIDATRYTGRWRCTVEGATIPCSLISWVFDPQPRLP